LGNVALTVPRILIRGSTLVRALYFAPAVIVFLILALWTGGTLGIAAGTAVLVLSAIRAWNIGLERTGEAIIVRNFWRTTSRPVAAICDVEVVRVPGFLGMIRIPHQLLEIQFSGSDPVRVAASIGGSLFGRGQLDSCRELLATPA
jgi:hypothetical protein